MGKRSGKQLQKSRSATSTEPRTSRMVSAGLFFCFFLSGAAALIYQVLWTKALGLIFGHTAYALATVLAVFMAGLAAGSAWLGRWGESRRKPLATYGWLELAVGTSAALSLIGLTCVRIMYHFVSVDQSTTLRLIAIRVIGASIVLFVPTFLMGGTLPILVRALKRHSPELGKRFARLYWINTTGAVVGTLAAGFVLLPAMGMRATLCVAVLLNGITGLIALWLERREFAAETKVVTQTQHQMRRVNTAGPLASVAKRKPTSPEAPHTLPRYFLLSCFASVGATAMAYEIGWTRLLATQLGSSTYAFTIMLATFLAGIALGSALFELCGRRAATSMTFAWTQAATALTTLLALTLFNRLPDVLAFILSSNDESFQTVSLAQFAVCSLAMLPTAVVFGFNFPLVTRLTTSEQESALTPSEEVRDLSKPHEGASVGRAYAWNTMGAIVGALASGFWLLPKWGSFHLLTTAAAVNAGLAVMLSVTVMFKGWSDKKQTSPSIFAGLACSVLLLAAIGAFASTNRFFDPVLSTFNTLLYWNLEGKPVPLPVQQKAHMMDVIYRADGLNATISVGQTDDIVALKTNGKTDASNNDINTQLMLGHIGAIAHPAPRRVLVIGFGAGMTLSALSRYPEIEQLDCVEIESAVIDAAPFLRSLNRDVLKDKRVHIIYDDGRHFLSTTHNRYDIIVSEPSNPWIEGIASLFTQEFYKSAQDRLTPGGIFVQWVQSYSLYPDDLHMIFATFLSQFRQASLWHGVKSDLILVGTTPGVPKILNRMQTLWSNPALRSDFEQMGMEKPEGLFGFYLLSDSGLRKYAANGEIDTDDRTLLEHRAPRSLLVRGLDDQNLHELYQAQDKVDLPGIFGDQRNSVLAAGAVTALNGSDIPDADRLLISLSEEKTPTVDEQIAQGRDDIAHADYPSATRAFDSALMKDQRSVAAAWGLAESNRLSNKPDLAQQQFLSILERFPSDLKTLSSLEQLYSDTSQPKLAADIQRRLIAATPHPSADAYAELGEMLKRAGELDEAVAAMNECLTRDPYNFQTHLNLGQIFDVQKKYSDSRKNLEFIQKFFPDADPQTYTLLHEVDAALGDSNAAAEAVRFGYRLFPDDPDILKLYQSL